MNPFSKLLIFLSRLDSQKIPYKLEHTRDETIMVTIPIPGELWEIEFFENGDVEVEKYISTAEIKGEELIEEIFLRYSE